MKVNLICFKIDKNEDGALDANIYVDDIIDCEWKDKVNKLVTENILLKLPIEIVALHNEKDIPVFEIFLTEDGLICNSFYLGFLAEDIKIELQELSQQLIVSITSKYKME